MRRGRTQHFICTGPGMQELDKYRALMVVAYGKWELTMLKFHVCGWTILQSQLDAPMTRRHCKVDRFDFFKPLISFDCIWNILKPHSPQSQCPQCWLLQSMATDEWMKTPLKCDMEPWSNLHWNSGGARGTYRSRAWGLMEKKLRIYCSYY